MDEDYYYSYTASPLTVKQAVTAGRQMEALHAKPTNSHPSPASRTPFTEVKQNSMSTVKRKTPQREIPCHLCWYKPSLCSDAQNTCLLLTAMSCHSNFLSQWPETSKSLEASEITFPACFLTSGSTCTAIIPATIPAKHHAAFWSKKLDFL